MWLIVVWVLLPFVLIPVVIWALNKINKYKNFVANLFRQGRINPAEFYTLNCDMGRQTGFQPNMPPVPPMPAVPPLPPVPQGEPAKPPYAAANFAEYGRVASTPPPVKKKEKNPALIMLVLGTVLVMLAGIVFSNAAWLYMNYWQRTGIIFAAAAFFFGVSAFSHKKLKLENTGMAFYMIGAVFTAVAFVTMGYFELMGEWLSVNGGGRLLLYSLATFIVSSMSFGAVKLYQKCAFVHVSLYGVLCSFLLMTLQIFNSNDSWALFLNIVSAVMIWLLHQNILKFGKLYNRATEIFVRVSVSIFAVLALPQMLSGGFTKIWSIPCFATAIIWYIQAVFYGVKLNITPLKIFHSLVITVISYQLTLILPESTEIQRIQLYLALICVCWVAYRLCDFFRSAFSDWLFVSLIFLTCLWLTFVHSTAEYAPITFFAHLALLLICAANALSERKHLSIFKKFLPIASIMLSIQIAHFAEVRLNFDTEVSFFFAAIITLMFAVFIRFSYKLELPFRTAFSDVIPTLTVCVIGMDIIKNAGEGEYFLAPLIFLFLSAFVLTFVLEKKPKSRIVTLSMRWFFALTLSFVAISLRSGIAYETNSVTATAVTALLLVTLSVCFRLIPKIRTPFSDISLLILIFANCNVLGNTPDSLSKTIVIISSLLSASAIAVWHGCRDEKKPHLFVLRILAPIPVITAAHELARLSVDCLEISDCYALLAGTVILGLAAAYFTLNEKFDHKPAYTVLQYSWSAATGILLLFACGNVGQTAEITIAAVLCIAFYFLFTSHDYNFATITPLISLILCANAAAEIPRSNILTVQDFRTIFLAVAFLLLITASKIFYREKLALIVPHRCTNIDFAAFCAALVPQLTTAGLIGYKSYRWALSAALIEIAVTFANMIRRGNNRDLNSVFKTLAMAAACCLIYSRPFLLTENELLAAKINLIPPILLGVAVTKIWKNHDKFAYNIGFAIHLCAFIALVFDVLIHKSIVNTIIVLCTVLCVIFVSFAFRNGRWFAVSAATFLALTVYITRGFFGEIEWWVYLLVAGIILIVVASVNEYLKTQGKNLKAEAKNFFRKRKF